MNQSDIKICYALWDRVDAYQNPKIRSLLTDLNFALDSILMPVIDVDLMEMIRWAAEDTDYSHIVIFDTGTVLGNSDKMRKAWHTLCEQRWLIAGHIMWRTADQYPWLHPQCFGINLQEWRNAGKPQIGLDTKVDLALPAAVRSPDNFHDDYTPLWVGPGLGYINATHVRFGWQVIAASIERGLEVVNLSMDIRTHKMFVYPDDQPQRLVETVNNIRSGYECSFDDVDNDTQRRFFRNQQWIVSESGNGSVFVFNTGDALVNYERYEEPGAIWATASGFKPFLEWFYRSKRASCSINLFDYNQPSLDMWKEIISDWTGENLYEFLRKIRPDCDDENFYCWGNKYDHETPEQASNRQELQLHDFCGDRDTFIAAWNEYKKLNHGYHLINLITEPRKFAQLMDPSVMNYVWINNIFYFNRSIRKYGIMQLGDSLAEMLDEMIKMGISNRVCGQSANAHFFDSAASIMPILSANPTPLYQCQLEFRNTGVRRWAGHPLAF